MHLSLPMEFRESTEIEKPSSGIAGCLIPITIVTVLIAMVSWAIYTLLQQDKKIDAFTTSLPAPITIATPSPADLEVLHAKLGSFATGETLTTTLSTADLNTLIATHPALVDLAPMLTITAITPEHISAQSAFPMRKLRSQDPRYLNAEITTIPRVANDGQLFFDLLSLEVPGKTIDEGFVGNYRQQRIIDSMVLRPFDAAPGIKAIITSITAIELSPDTLTITRSAPAPPENLQ